jgi:hypothetical protein
MCGFSGAGQADKELSEMWQAFERRNDAAVLAIGSVRATAKVLGGGEP